MSAIKHRYVSKDSCTKQLHETLGEAKDGLRDLMMTNVNGLRDNMAMRHAQLDEKSIEILDHSKA